MKRFVQAERRTQGILFARMPDDYVANINPGRAIDVFVEEPDLGKLGFKGVDSSVTGRPAYHPASVPR